MEFPVLPRRCAALLSLAAVAAIGSPALKAQKFDGLAMTPPMGWNSWNTFEANISEALIQQTADALVSSGMRDAGYTYVVIDDCWSEKERDANGLLVPDHLKFPHGMKAVGDYLHARGLKFGMYTCVGPRTCADFPGSWGHEFSDARQFAEWGVDYLKDDWCNHGTMDPKDAYSRMRDGLHAAGRPIIFSLCEWGSNRPWEWAKDIGNLWRTTGDIYASYDGLKGWEHGWKKILDLQNDLVPNNGQDGIGQFAGPGHWNDPDMLEVGNPGLSLAESRAHFSFWCILAAPLIAGNDVRSMSEDTRKILTDKDVVAIDQDPLGKEGFRALQEPSKGIEIWMRELSHGEWAVCVLNTTGAEADLTVEWKRLWTLKGAYSVRDVWKKSPAGDTKAPSVFKIGSHDVALLKLTPLGN